MFNCSSRDAVQCRWQEWLNPFSIFAAFVCFHLSLWFWKWHCLNICWNVISLTYQRPLTGSKGWTQQISKPNILAQCASWQQQATFKCFSQKHLSVFIRFSFATNSALPPRKGAQEWVVVDFLFLPAVSGLQNISTNFRGPKGVQNVQDCMKEFFFFIWRGISKSCL